MFTLISSLASLVSLVCAILVLIKIFQDGKVLIGVLGIVTCGIVAFVYGWMNVARYNIRNVMIAWTAAWLVSLACIPFTMHVTTTTTYNGVQTTHTTGTP